MLYWETLFYNFSAFMRRPNESMRLIVTAVIGIIAGFFIGNSFHTVSITKVLILLPLSRIKHKQESTKKMFYWLPLFPFWCCQVLLPSGIISFIEDRSTGQATEALLNHAFSSEKNKNINHSKVLSAEDLKVHA